MKKGIIVLVLILTVNTVSAEPEITSHTGTISDGSSVTITGSGFGATGPSLYKWDDFEGSSHIVGEDVGPGPGSIAWSFHTSRHAKINDTEPRTGSKYARAEFTEHWRNGFAFDYGDTLSPVYLTWWWRWDSIGSNPSGNWKPHWPVAFNPTLPESPRVSMCFMGDSGVFGIDPGTGAVVTSWHGKPDELDWVRFEFFGNESTAGLSDGTVILDAQFSEGAPFESIFAYEGDVMTHDNPNEHWTCSLFGDYVGMETGVHYNIDTDDVYIADTRARVEIGDNPDWDSCTHREIQIPTAWSDSSITFEVNQGSFLDGEQVYLFVVDANGEASAGYPVTIGQVKEGPQITSAPSTISHGESVSISGLGFGTKTTAAPMIWDDCEAGNIEDNWDYRYPNACSDSDSNMHYDTTSGLGQGVAQAHSHSTRYAVGRHDGEGTGECGSGFNNMKGPNVLLGKSITGSSYTYLSYYYRHDPEWGGGVANYKLGRWSNSILTLDGDASYYSYWYGNWNWHTNSYVHDLYSCPEEGLDPGDGWYKIEIMCYHATNGWLKIYENGNLLPGENGDDYFNGDLSGTNFNKIVIGGFGGRAASQGGYCTGWQNDFRYYDDLYFDNTLARVILGNTQDLETSTVREIQIPTTWSDNSITLETNQGSFLNGTDVYLFVVDENGNATNGYPIMIEGTSDCGNSVCNPGETCSSCPDDCTQIHVADDNPCNGCINMSELIDYITLWKTTNQVELPELMDAIRLWKEGCPDT